MTDRDPSLESRAAALEPMLADPDVRVRKSAVVALGRMACATSCDLLSKTLSDADEGVRVLACQALGRLANPLCLPRAFEAAHDTSPQVRAGVLWIFANVAAHGGIDEVTRRSLFPAVVTLAFDPDDGVRADAAAVLGALADPRVFEPLMVLVEDDCARVRANACASLGLLGDARVVDVLLSCLTSDEVDTLVAASAIDALGHAVQKGAVDAGLASRAMEVLTTVASQPVDGAERDGTETSGQVTNAQPTKADVRACAVWAMGQFAGVYEDDRTRQIDLLRSLVEDDAVDEWCRGYARESLAALEG